MLEIYERLEEVLKDLLRLIVVKEEKGEPIDDLVLKAISVARDSGLKAGFYFRSGDFDNLRGVIKLPTGEVSWFLDARVPDYVRLTTMQQKTHISDFIKPDPAAEARKKILM